MPMHLSRTSRISRREWLLTFLQTGCWMLGALLVFLNPGGASLLAQPQASALPPSPVVFSRTEKLDPPITCVPLAEGDRKSVV